MVTETDLEEVEVQYKQTKNLPGATMPIRMMHGQYMSVVPNINVESKETKMEELKINFTKT
tara:strand:+ start:1481 stop:1663 length:183 start_codon:yes stop_codon:yes gene_type:complete